MRNSQTDLTETEEEISIIEPSRLENLSNQRTESEMVTDEVPEPSETDF